MLQGGMQSMGHGKFLILSARSAWQNQVNTLPAAYSYLSFKSDCKSSQCVFVLDLLRMIFALGISMTFLNVPVEWLSLGFEWTWMLLFQDIRQGIFYSTLFCFWIIFCGEHLMVSILQLLSIVPFSILSRLLCTFFQQKTLKDQSQRNRLTAYWWQFGLVVFSSSILLIFDLSER